MNQILSTQPDNNNYGNNKVKNKKPKKEKISNYGTQPANKADIVKVARTFAILLIIFSLAIIGNSTYAIINSKPKEEDNINVVAEKIGIEATIKVTGEKPIKQLVYYWGQEDKTIIDGNGTVNLEATVTIPDGNNVLNFYVMDYYGNKKEYYKQYINNRTDKNKPTIELSISGNSINIIAKDDKEISYMLYHWNDEEEKRIDIEKTAEDKTTIEAKVDVKKGQNTLTIIAVDADGNKETKVQTFKGANKPSFDVSVDGTNLIINAKDDEGIAKIAITVDGVTTDTGDTPINQKEITATQTLEPGTHTITITVTNLSGLVEEQSYTAELQ